MIDIRVYVFFACSKPPCSFSCACSVPFFKEKKPGLLPPDNYYLAVRSCFFTLAHPSYFVVRWPGSASKIPPAFIFILGSRTPPGGGSPLSESFCPSPIHPQRPVCWYLCPLRYVLPGELRNDLPVRNQGTHFLQRRVFLWVTQLSSPRRVVTRTSCTLGIGGILEVTQPG